jgi:hypothetical protein
VIVDGGIFGLWKIKIWLDFSKDVRRETHHSRYLWRKNASLALKKFENIFKMATTIYCVKLYRHRSYDTVENEETINSGLTIQRIRE